MVGEFTGQIVDFVNGVRGAEIDPAARGIAARSFADTIAVALAGWAEPVSAKVLRQARFGEPAVPLLGAAATPAPEFAALVNGTAAHALDYDDVSPTVTTHPSAVMVPTALSAAYVADRPGRDAVTAYLIGVEVSTRVGQMMGFDHYQLGWHATSTLGTIGAAAAAGYLLGLNAEQLRWAIGLGGSLAAGLRRNFGTMAKPFHAGLAAENGVRAALLAAEGVTAEADIFGVGGYFLAMNGGRPLRDQGFTFGKPYEVLVGGVAVKNYPCCWATHRMIDGVLQLRTKHGLRPELVERIEIVTAPGGLAPLNRARPDTGLEGKFSGHYAAAAALFDGKVNLASFTDAAVRRRGVVEFLARVEVREAPRTGAEVGGLEDGVVRVAMTLSGGHQVETAVQYSTGSPQRPLTESQLAAKVADCMGYYSQTTGNPLPDADRVLSVCSGLERAPSVRSWLGELRQAVGG